MIKEKKHPYYLFPDITPEKNSNLSDLSIPTQKEFEELNINFEKIDNFDNIEKSRNLITTNTIDIKTKNNIGYLINTAIISKIKEENSFIGTTITNYFKKAQTLNSELGDLVNADEITQERCMDAMLILFQNKLVYAIQVKGSEDYPKITKIYSEIGTGITPKPIIHSKKALITDITTKKRDRIRCKERFNKRAYSKNSINKVIFVPTEIYTQKILGFDYNPDLGFIVIETYKENKKIIKN